MFLRYRFALLAILFAFGTNAQAWTPGTGSPTAVQGFSVDTTNRTDVLSFYNTIYFASQNYAADLDWLNGSVANDLPGTTSLTFKNDVQRSVNFYRALAGVSTNITFSDSDSANDQLEALITSANDVLNHFPPTSYADYSANGALAASHSNLALGIYGPGAIDGYMMDLGSNNLEVGHRRWILFPQQSVMGTGDIPACGSFNAANALWVYDTVVFVPAKFVSWPNSGYCPLALLPARWSLSYLNADFTAATVTMTQDGTTVPCAIIYSDSRATLNNTIIGDNTIVWEPSNLPTSISADTPFTVTVSGIGGGGPTSYTYTVKVFDPNVLGQTTTIAGSSSPPSNGAAYTFNSISEADAYDLQVSNGSAAAWNEGAEALPAPQVSFNTTSPTDSNPLIQSAAGTVHLGANSFQLSFPSDVDGNGVAESYDFSDQSFEITRQIIPTATSQLQFYDLCRFALPTTTLSAQVSTDNGTTWTQVKSIPGVVPSGGSSADWDQSFNKITVSLAAYAGEVILVRFVLSGNGQAIDLGSPIAYYGFFLDDITVTNSTQLTNVKDTTLAGNATSFTLNASTAGAALQSGTSYYLRIRPEVGLKYYGFGNYDLVSVVPAVTTTGYSNWVSTAYPSVTGGASGDFSGDGIPNGLKYAFGLNPTVRNSAASIPAPVASGSTLTLSFTAPAGAGGITYGAQSSTDLVTWTSVPDTGSGLNHFFQVNVTGSHLFMRHVISIAP